METGPHVPGYGRRHPGHVRGPRGRSGSGHPVPIKPTTTVSTCPGPADPPGYMAVKSPASAKTTRTRPGIDRIVDHAVLRSHRASRGVGGWRLDYRATHGGPSALAARFMAIPNSGYRLHRLRCAGARHLDIFADLIHREDRLVAVRKIAMPSGAASAPGADRCRQQSGQLPMQTW